MTPVDSQQVLEAPDELVARATVREVERLSPAFVRVVLESPAFVDLGIEGFDTRIKLLFPGADGRLSDLPERAGDWYEAWAAAPESARSPMRTYTVRDVLPDPLVEGQQLLVVDLVVHEQGPHGPACAWALAAAPGDEIWAVTPHRAAAYGGMEFDPGEQREVLIAGDETALPAIARILTDMTPGPTGHAFVEVPSAADILPLTVPVGLEITWLVRDDAEHGRRLVDAVRGHLGLGALTATDAQGDGRAADDRDDEIWETPTYSGAGEDVDAQLHQRTVGSDLSDLYAWIAGESWLVKTLRRSLVTDLGVERRQVAFMGYWRQGVAMKA